MNKEKTKENDIVKDLEKVTSKENDIVEGLEKVTKKDKPKEQVQKSKVSYNSWMKDAGSILIRKGFSEKTILARAIKAAGKDTVDFSKSKTFDDKLKVVFK